MSNFDITNATFNEGLEKLNTTDRAHADVFNERLEKLIKNDVALKNEVEKGKNHNHDGEYYGKAEIDTKLGNVTIGEHDHSFAGSAILDNKPNTKIGEKALANPTTGYYNTAVGYEALQNSTAGYRNIAVGSEALKHNTIGYSNIAVGSEALYYNTTGKESIAIGDQALRSSTINSENVAIGKSALQNSTAGYDNTAIGCYALSGNTTGYDNTALGHRAGGGTTGSMNTAIGKSALQNSTTGRYNTAIGYSAGIHSGSNFDNTTSLGYGTRVLTSNEVVLGNNQVTTLRCNVNTITSLSDSRVKENIEEANLHICVETVKKLPLKRFKYKNFAGARNDKTVCGWLAEDFEEVFPKSVKAYDREFPVLDEDGNEVKEMISTMNENDEETIQEVTQTFEMKQVKEITPTEVVPTLWGTVQYLIGKIERLEEEIRIIKEGDEISGQ